MSQSPRTKLVKAVRGHNLGSYWGVVFGRFRGRFPIVRNYPGNVAFWSVLMSWEGEVLVDLSDITLEVPEDFPYRDFTVEDYNNVFSNRRDSGQAGS